MYYGNKRTTFTSIHSRKQSCFVMITYINMIKYANYTAELLAKHEIPVMLSGRTLNSSIQLAIGCFIAARQLVQSREADVCSCFTKEMQQTGCNLKEVSL